MKKTLKINYFALYRDVAGKSEEELQSDASDANSLFEELQQRYPELPRFDATKIAINDELARWDTPLNDGDRILLFPPVAGG